MDDAGCLDFVAPERPRRPRHHYLRPPYDFFYALLNVWDRTRLGHLMRVLRWALDELPREEYNVDYWNEEQHGVTPVLTPSLEFLAPAAAFERMAEVALDEANNSDEATLVASMRLLAVTAFVADYRVRAVIMTNHPGVHGALRTQPPDRYVVWKFFENGGRQVLCDLFQELVACERQLRKSREKQTLPPVLGLASVRGSAEERGPSPFSIAARHLTDLRGLLLVPAM